MCVTDRKIACTRDTHWHRVFERERETDGWRWRWRERGRRKGEPQLGRHPHSFRSKNQPIVIIIKR